MPFSERLPKEQQKQQTTKYSEPLTFHKEEKQAYEQVEMLFDGKSPEMPDQVAVLDYMNSVQFVPKVVLIQEERPKPVLPGARDQVKAHEQANHSQVHPLGWLNAKEAADVEGFQGKAPCLQFILLNTPGNQDA